MQIHELPDVTAIGSGGYFATDNGSQTTKIDYDALAKAIIEQYSASTLAGSAQSVKAALDGVNSNLIVPNNRIAIPNNSDINTYTTPGVYAVPSDASASTMTNLPINASGKLIVIVRGNNPMYLQQKYITTSSAYTEYVRNYNNGTWTAWEQLPTRAEIDALNSNSVHSDKGGADAVDYLQVGFDSSYNPEIRVHDKVNNVWYHESLSALNKVTNITALNSTLTPQFVQNITLSDTGAGDTGIPSMDFYITQPVVTNKAEVYCQTFIYGGHWYIKVRNRTDDSVVTGSVNIRFLKIPV